MQNWKRTILITSAALLLASPALADDPAPERDRDRAQDKVSAEQRQQAREERRKAVHSLPEEQRAAVREAHRKSMTPEERAQHRKRMQERQRQPGASNSGKGKHKGGRKRN